MKTSVEGTVNKAQSECVDAKFCWLKERREEVGAERFKGQDITRLGASLGRRVDVGLSPACRASWERAPERR